MKRTINNFLKVALIFSMTCWGAYIVLGANISNPGIQASSGGTSLTLGTGVQTALAVNTGSAGAFVVQNGALGTPSSGTLTNATGLPVAGGGTGVATITSGKAVIGQGTSAVTTTSIFSNAAAVLTNAKSINLTIQSTVGTGSTDLKDAATGIAYVVPANKIAIIGSGRMYNGNAGTSLNYIQLKAASVYYRLTTSVSSATGVGNNIFSNALIVLVAGDSVAISSDQTTQNCWLPCIEADSTAPIKTARILALANGDNTLYTCPASKTAFILSAAGASSGGQINICNASTASRNYYANIVTSGGAVATTNQTQLATAIADVTGSGMSVSCGLAAGDFLSVNTNNGTAGQVAWVSVIEY